MSDSNISVSLGWQDLDDWPQQANAHPLSKSRTKPNAIAPTPLPSTEPLLRFTTIR